MTERWRCFVALPLDGSLTSALSSAVAAWRRDPRADTLRWAEPGGWHLTLVFLGAIDPDDIARAAAAARRVAALHWPTEVTTGRLGAFPRPGSARVLWYGVSDTDGRLAALADDLSDAMQLPRDEPYRPHITLARARRRPVDLRGWVEAAAVSAPGGRLEVDTIELMRSHLGSGPARYETLATFTLGGAS